MFEFFKNYIKSLTQKKDVDAISRENQNVEIERLIQAKGYMIFHTAGDEVFPIQAMIKGEWNTLMQKQSLRKYNLHFIYKTFDKTVDKFYARTLPGNNQAAYIVCFGYDENEVKKLIKLGKFNETIIGAINYQDWKHKTTIDPDYLVEIFMNAQFNLPQRADLSSAR